MRRHLGTAFGIAMLVVVAAGVLLGQIVSAQRQARLEHTISNQRVLICDQAVALNNMASEVRPVLVPIYHALKLPNLPPVRPLPASCTHLKP